VLRRYQPEDQGVCDAIQETEVAEEEPHSPNLGKTLPYFPIGFGADDEDLHKKNFVALVGQDTEDANSFMGGVQIASLHQFGSIVLGLEADWSGASDMESRTTGSFEYFGQVNVADQLWEYLGAGDVWFNSELDWLATFRAKLGTVLSSDGRLLGYVTGGAAVAKVSVSHGGQFEAAGFCVDKCGMSSGGSDTLYQFGGVIGAGLEYAITDNFSIGAEYLYVALTGQDEKTVSFFDNYDSRQINVTEKVGFDDIHSIRVKANIKIGN
jgi:opacity protein-like surface antigen